jgi:hypothetical protein
VNPVVCGGDDGRRALLEQQSALNGIDYVEVEQVPPTLRVFFVNPLPPNAYGLAADPSRVRVEGGVRIRNLRVTGVVNAGDHLVVSVDRSGDFSTYTLVLQAAELDPLFSACDFSFKAGCPTRFDCRRQDVCPPPAPVAPLIDYLAKDYASFRQALLDRLPVLVPGWTEQHEADLGVTLVELLAYAGDLLSYYQDSVANEAFLPTARRRVSVRRHARLVDYAMHDGASARAFVQFETEPGTSAFVPADTPVLSRVRAGENAVLYQASSGVADRDVEKALRDVDVFFRTLEDITCADELGAMQIYTWGRDDCCLPRGTTELFLRGPLPSLTAGALVILEEALGPATGLPEDADPTHRQAVRLTEVSATNDPLLGVPLVHVRFAAEDALTQPFCLSTSITSGDTTLVLEDVTLVRGNVVLAEHGRSVVEEFRPAGVALTPGAEPHPGPTPHADGVRLRLSESPLAQSVPTVVGAPVAAILQADIAAAQPNVVLTLGVPPAIWTPERDLLHATAFDRTFVAEIDERNVATLRFGDGTYGEKPSDFSSYALAYRVGVGTAGNVGSEALAHLLLPDSSAPLSIRRVRNPLPAFGGVEPESSERVKAAAPVAFRRGLERAVTEDDYAKLAERIPGVARAVATFRWTGSFYTVFVAIDRIGGADVDDAFRALVTSSLEPYRIAGYDLEVNGPTYVPLDVTIDVCVARDHFRADVEAAVRGALSSKLRSDGSLGFFHPDRFSFGQPLYVSALYAAVMAVEGVDGANVTRLQRWGRTAAGELEQGYVPAGRLEILRLDDDPDAQENGVLLLELGGGK